MESLNLNTLATSLPTTQQKAEQELLNNFKAAALSITTLYRSSRQNAKRAHNAGYAAACQDLLTMIQQGVSVGGLGNSMPSSSSDGNDDGMTIGRVMDWTEARLEAIRAQEEEEDEEEEREGEKERTRSTSCVPPGHTKPTSSHSSLPPALPTPSSPTVHFSNPPPEPITPSPALHQSNVPRATHRSKSRTTSKGEMLSSHTSVPTLPTTSVFNFMPEMVTPISPPISFPEMSTLPAVGTKRRHAMMMMLDATTPSTTGSNTSTQPPAVVGSPASPANFSGPVRRRTRSNRGFQQNQNINNIMQPSNESMEIEDDGRERKRVARR